VVADILVFFFIFFHPILYGAITWVFFFEFFFSILHGALTRTYGSVHQRLNRII